MSDPSSITGTVLTTPRDGSVTTAKLVDASVTTAKLSDSPNLLLNPSFETVLYGTHTNAIARNNYAGGGTKNTQFPGWQTSTVISNPDMTVAEETGTIRVPGSKSCKITVAAVGGGCELRQDWSSTHFLDFMAHAVRSAYLNFAMDVKLSSATANACRLEIYTDGTGGTSTYSSYHGANTNWERLLVSVQVPSDATRVVSRIQFYSTTPTYYLDCGMVTTSASIAVSLPYIQRLPVSLNGDVDAAGPHIAHSPGSTAYIVTGSGGFSTTDYDVNAFRPHWATHVRTEMLMSASVAGNAMRVKGNGRTNNWMNAYGTSAATYGTAHGHVQICQDGQLQIQVEESDGGTSNGYAYFRGWRGEGL
jgi:hypothetical protein